MALHSLPPLQGGPNFILPRVFVGGGVLICVAPPPPSGDVPLQAFCAAWSKACSLHQLQGQDDGVVVQS